MTLVGLQGSVSNRALAQALTEPAPASWRGAFIDPSTAWPLAMQRSLGNHAVGTLLHVGDGHAGSSRQEALAVRADQGPTRTAAAGSPPVVSRLVGTGLHKPGRSLDYQARVHRVLTDRIAKNPRFMVAAAGAFIGGVLGGARANLTGDDLRAFERRFQASFTIPIPQGPLPIPIPIRPPITAGFLAGTVVGFAQGLAMSLRDLTSMAMKYGADPEAVAEDFLSLLESLLSAGAEDAVRATGEQVGAQFAGKVRGLAGASDSVFGYELGKLVGPTLVDVILAVVTGGAGAAKGVVALAGRLGRLAGFRAAAGRLKALGRRLGPRLGAEAVRPPGGVRGGPLVRHGRPGRPPTPEESARTAPLTAPRGTGQVAGLRPIRDLAEARRARDQWIREGRDFEMTPDPLVYKANWQMVGGTGRPPLAYFRGDKLVFNPRRIGHVPAEVAAAREARVAQGSGPARSAVARGGSGPASGTRWRTVGQPVGPPLPQSRAGSTLPPLNLSPEVRPLRRIDDIGVARSFRDEHVAAGGRYLEQYNRIRYQEDWFLAGGPGTAPPAYVTESGVVVYDANLLGPLPGDVLIRAR